MERTRKDIQRSIRYIVESWSLLNWLAPSDLRVQAVICSNLDESWTNFIYEFLDSGMDEMIFVDFIANQVNENWYQAEKNDFFME